MLKFPDLSQLFFKNAQWLEKKQNSILSAALIITIANILSSVSGLIRERILIATYFGSEAGQAAYEAFQVAFQIPDLLFQIIVLGALSAAFIPIFTKYRQKDDQQAFAVTTTVMNLLLIIFLVIAAVVAIWAEPITAARTGAQFNAEQIKIAAQLTRIMLLAQFFFAISNFLTGILQSFQRFIVPALAPVTYNLGILLGVGLFYHQLGIYAAGIGVVIGALIHMAIQLPFAKRLGFRFDWRLKLKLTGVAELFKLIPLRVLTLSLSELQNLALGFFATSIGNLSFVVIKLALRLMTIPIRLFGVPISQASLPFLAQQSEENDQRFRSLVLQSLNQISFLAFPASVLLLILRLPIVRLVFGADNFPWKTTVLTSKAVAIIALSVAAQAMVQLLIRAFHALKDTRTPFLVTAGTVALYLISCWLFVFQLGSDVQGIAWSTTIVAFIELGLFLFLLERKIGQVVLNRCFLVAQLKIILASFLMAVFIYLPFRIFDEIIFDTSKTIELIALTVTTGTIGLLVYFYFSALLDVEELDYFRELASRFGKWQQPLVKSQEVLIEPGSDSSEI